MKAKFGAIVVDGRGKIGGHVMSKNRSGAIMRTKVTPINRNSTAQTTARNLLSALSQEWAGLTDAQRSAWNAAVDGFKKTNIFGDSYSPSGKNLYAMLNANLALVGVARISVPPLPSDVPSMTSITLTAAAGAATMSLAYAASPVPADSAFLIEMTGGLSAGKSFVKSQYRKIGFLDAADVTPENVKAAWQTVFGSMPVAGQKLFCRVVGINKVTGQRGSYLSTSCIVAA